MQLQRVRRFTVTSLLAFIAVAVVLGYLFRTILIDGLVRTEEEANVNLTKVFSNSLWQSDFGPFVRAMEEKPAAQLKAAPQLAELHRKVLALMHGSTIFKVKVYDMKGMTVYSTELAQIGEDKSNNAGVMAAWRGRTSSELVHRDTFSALESEVQDRDLIQSYIPQYEAVTGKVVGVFEVYSDVTPLLAEIGNKQWYAMAVVVCAMAGLHLALFLILT
jgi:two-component system NtrC family sensor kinase